MDGYPNNLWSPMMAYYVIHMIKKLFHLYIATPSLFFFFALNGINRVSLPILVKWLLINTARRVINESYKNVVSSIDEL